MKFLGNQRSTFPITATVFMIVFWGCNSNTQKPLQLVTAPAKVVLTQPFRFHKTIEVSPGNVFDIFSWGRGSGKSGSFLILESDSAEVKFTTTTGDLDGAITDVYNTDMDMDGNPEILIQAKSKDSTKYTQIYAFEYKDNKAQKLDFPKLTSFQKKGYHGEDNFYINEGVLMREFPVFKGDSTLVKSTNKRVLEYGIRNNSFTVKTVDQESETKKQAVSAKDITKKTSVKEASVTTSKNTSQKKHHRVAKHYATKKTSHKRSSNRLNKKKRRHRS